MYQILWKTNPILLIYNKRMFREAGYDHPPETYDDYLDAGSKIGRDTDGDGYVDRWVGITDIRARWRDRLFDFYPLYIAASGGKTLIEDGEIAFQNGQAVGVFRFFQNVYSNGYFPREILDDHIPFKKIGIPVIDIIDFEFGPGNSFWHSSEDNIGNISAKSLKIIGKTTLNLLFLGNFAKKT